MDAIAALGYLAGIAVRSLCLAAAAGLTLIAFRMRTAAVRHAVWTVVMAGMLALGALSPLLPPLEVRLLAPRPAAVPVVAFPAVATTIAPAQSPPVSRTPAVEPRTWLLLAAGLYAAGVLIFLARLAFSYLFTRRLVRASTRIEHTSGDALYESSWISVPMTVGWREPKILLPAGWREWDAAKLDAVLAHERTHIRRADWLVAMLAGINRSIFWFHPLAWWLEQRLGILAEQACDDAALLLVGEREPYAQALLDMAAAVRTGQGRLVWEAMAMANANEVRKRIERILDETRQIPRGLNRLRWAGLLACSLPLVYLAATVQLAPAQISYPDLRATAAMGSAEAAAAEQQLAANPHDLEKRGRLVLYYYATGQRQQRIAHTLWLIANHPESGAAVLTSSGLLSRTTALNDAADYTRAATLWKQQAAVRAKDAQVQANAAQFFLRAGSDYEEAERLLIAARTLAPGNQSFTDSLGGLYASAILSATGDPSFPKGNSAFASRAQSKLEASTDGTLMSAAGAALASRAIRPQPGQTLPAGTLNLDDHAALTPAIELGQRLLTRSTEYGAPARALMTVVQTSSPQQAFTTLQNLAVSQTPASPAPMPTYRVEPVYPPLARQARIQGDIRLRAVIATDGSVKELSVINGHPLLVPAALEAVKQWRFVGQSSPLTTELVVPFRLPDGPAPTAVPAPAGARGPQSQSLPVLTPTYKVDPEYPPLARQARIQGVVRISAVINADGSIKTLAVISGHPLMVPNALEAAKQYRFAPQTSEARTEIVVPFQLNDGTPFPSQTAPLGGLMGKSDATPMRIRVGGNVQAAKISNKVDPIYPADAREAGIRGTVQLSIEIATDGVIEKIEVIEGHPALAAAAVAAVRQWRYQPTLLNGQPVSVLTTITIPFPPE